MSEPPDTPSERRGTGGRPSRLPTLDRPYLWLPTLVAVALLLFLAGPLGREIRQPLTVERALTYAGLVAFVAIYLWAIPSDIAGRSRGRVLPAVVALTVLSVAISLLDSRANWSVLYVLTAAGAGRLVPSRSSLVAIAVTAALAGLTPQGFRADVLRSLETSVEVALVGLVVLGFSQYERTVRELEHAQDEIARNAADVERARIARDLHDLLGQSLSTIALKIELARKLLERDPDRAAAELRDVEAVARTSLRDVRQAVAGYRQVDLDTELAGARVALDAAGIDVLVERPEAELDPEVDVLLAWVVREGVTNVVRHSNGSECSIEIEASDGTVRLDIVDNGRRPAPGEAAGSGEPGSGLRGIRERVGRLGGSLQAGWRSGDGYGLRVVVPAVPARRDGPGAAVMAAGVPAEPLAAPAADEGPAADGGGHPGALGGGLSRRAGS